MITEDLIVKLVEEKYEKLNESINALTGAVALGSVALIIIAIISVITLIRTLFF